VRRRSECGQVTESIGSGMPNSRPFERGEDAVGSKGVECRMIAEDMELSCCQREGDTDQRTITDCRLDRDDALYCTIPFCLGPPMSPHHPICHRVSARSNVTSRRSKRGSERGFFPLAKKAGWADQRRRLGLASTVNAQDLLPAPTPTPFPLPAQPYALSVFHRRSFLYPARILPPPSLGIHAAKATQSSGGTHVGLAYTLHQRDSYSLPTQSFTHPLAYPTERSAWAS
jgi:hypothetical protein